MGAPWVNVSPMPCARCSPDRCSPARVGNPTAPQHLLTRPPRRRAPRS
ncbi:hypothetical protein KTR9_4179 [Gordonia sp. KTR9]|nr:hypothetical protein KTR9_4179 [Gordonia sp. KTR9]